jgi:hypothetical protein
MVQVAKSVREGVGGANVEAEAETVIATVEGINTGASHSEVFLEGMAVITASAGATGLTLRVRREGVGGTEVAKMVVSAVAGKKQEIGFQCVDNVAGELANCSYVLTLQSEAAEKQKSVSSRLTATF